MRIDALTLEGFRNYDRQALTFHHSCNVIYGENAQGKTNLLEAMVYLSCGKSPRARADRELIGFDRDKAYILGQMFTRDREFRTEVELFRGRRRKASVNGVPAKNNAALSDVLHTVFFSPEDLMLIREGAAARRRFMDLSLCQLRPRYAEALAEYVLDMGYTHVELMGISEYPYDGSWGYQVTGYYAPTSRYGSPKDFMYLVNYLHEKGIGVILDWVPAHFPRDAHGLAEFDGTCLYEYADPRKGEHPDWGTKIFDYGKNEVKNFLIGSALMWVEKYHVDGLRVDAVASMLYLDYGKQDGQWVANKYGGNENLEAIEFFKHLNTLVRGRNKNAMMIAEESTAWPRVTGEVEDGGLYFSYKWNMGWMHDFLDYMKLDPYFRKDNHNKMTFAMTYNAYEKYVLVLSHDEVVHLKCSMLNKMPGLEDDKYRNLRVGYAFMMGHPGKKLLFMGQDFAQSREWSEARELDWYLLDNPKHKAVSDFMRELLHIYQKYPAMYELDASWDGFEWINANDNYRSIFSFIRKSKTGKNNLLFVCNFTPMAYDDYRVGVPEKRKMKLLLNSEDVKFGGKDVKRQKTYTPRKKECDGRPYSIAYPLPPYGVAVFVY